MLTSINITKTIDISNKIIYTINGSFNYPGGRQQAPPLFYRIITIMHLDVKCYR